MVDPQPEMIDHGEHAIRASCQGRGRGSGSTRFDKCQARLKGGRDSALDPNADREDAVFRSD